MSNCDNHQELLTCDYQCGYNPIKTCLNEKRKEDAHMPISEKDLKYMEKVAAFYRSTISSSEPNGSIKRTADEFNINRNKVRKILVTMGELESPYADDVLYLRNQGYSIKEIAESLGVSVATVSTSLPYEDKMDNTLAPSDHTSKVREYRAYEKEQLKKQKKKQVKEASEKGDISNTWKGENMSDNKVEVTKEWQKDIKMSYTESYHRPHRITKDEQNKLNEDLAAELEQDPSKELLDAVNKLSFIRKKADEEARELDEIISKKELTEKDSERIKQIIYDLGHFTGALNERNDKALEEIAGDRLPPDPSNVVRLHMELYDEYEDWYDEIDKRDAEVFKKYGKLKYGDHISRDVVVPYDIPLYALHYVIQRVFGWENSHLHQFELPKERFKAITENNAAMWSKLVGILFRSPYMPEEDEFWCDDYNGGSFKNWLRKKYTGPYLSQCHGEGILSCIKDMGKIRMDEEYYVMYCNGYNRKTDKYDGEEFLARVSPVYDYEGKKIPEPEPLGHDDTPYRVEIRKFKDVPAEGLRRIFDRDPMSLLERLPLDCVLAAGKLNLPKNWAEKERTYIETKIADSGEEIYNGLKKYIDRITKERIDSPGVQVYPTPVTDTLIYSYDFGDSWKIRITASENCADLVESERITQTELDRANVKCREVYRPVLLARDGEMLVDDVGGIHGFADFLEEINPDLKGLTAEEKEEAKQKKKESLTWAKGLGWHRENISDFNLI